MQGWKLANPVRVIDKVKAALASERMGAEWELLEDGEWEDEGKQEAIMDGNKYIEDGEAATKEAARMDKALVEQKGKEKGTSGWMKLKSKGSAS